VKGSGAASSAAKATPALDARANPEVSQVSRFRDNVWNFSNEDQNPSTHESTEQIRWAFPTPRRGRFTDPPFRSLCESTKQFIYALLWHPVDEPPFAASAAVQLFQRTTFFIAPLLSYPNPILRFKDVLPHHCDDYIEHVLAMDLSASYKYGRIHILQKLFQYRDVMTDGLVVDPFQGKPLVRKIAGYSHASQAETQTAIIPDEILGPLVRLALEYVDRGASYLLDAFDGIEEIRKAGCNFEYRANPYVRGLRPSAYGLKGSRFEGGIGGIRQLYKELGFLQTACFVLIAFATGMRISEILSLRRGCLRDTKGARKTGPRVAAQPPVQNARGARRTAC
jgi:hypothetical protein